MLAVVVCSLALGGVRAGDDEGEIGLQLGVLSPDRDLTGEPQQIDNVEPFFGVRGDYFFAPRWGWFADALYSDLELSTPAGGADWFAVRTGLEILGTPHWESYQTFLTFGGGWKHVLLPSFEDDFDRLFASLSMGQRFDIGRNTLLRWELRIDHTLTDDGLAGADLTTGLFALGLTAGIPSRNRDRDGDGVPDRRDDCPGTPAGARVDSRGCPVDSDGDGVIDGADRCPGTPAGMRVDATGCLLDSDGDGVSDDRDACADTASGARVDSRGCPVDSDGDGVADGLDRCPDTPRYAHVDERGCPSDSDGDGVLDGIDRCPTTPSGAKVGPDGCPLTAPLFEEERDTLVLEGVYFEVNEATLTENSRTVLDLVARSLIDWPEVRVEVGGHTDSSGSDSLNLRLSEQRARAVRDHLVERGVSGTRLEARGYGESRPIADNGTAAGREKNRRVELKQLR